MFLWAVQAQATAGVGGSQHRPAARFRLRHLRHLGRQGKLVG